MKNNPNGEPFILKPIISMTDSKRMGMSQYWGEGNTYSALLNMFILYLNELFGAKKEVMHFALQVFSGINVCEALSYWTSQLKAKDSQFVKPIVTISGSIGTYRHKCLYGVITVSYHNKKLRDIIVGMLPR